MAQKPKKLMADTALKSKVKQVNKVLEDQEPENITTDPYSKYTGYKVQHIIDAMNDVFGPEGWGMEEILSSTEMQTDQEVNACMMVWIGEKTTFRTSWGGAKVTRGSLADARKSAQTDAVKKALSYFSIGNKAFRGELQGEQNGSYKAYPKSQETNKTALKISDKQLKFLHTLLQQKGWKKEHLYSKYEVSSTNDLTREQAANIIDSLIKLEDVQNEENQS